MKRIRFKKQALKFVENPVWLRLSFLILVILIVLSFIKRDLFLSFLDYSFFEIVELISLGIAVFGLWMILYVSYFYKGVHLKVRSMLSLKEKILKILFILVLITSLSSFILLDYYETFKMAIFFSLILGMFLISIFNLYVYFSGRFILFKRFYLKDKNYLVVIDYIIEFVLLLFFIFYFIMDLTLVVIQDSLFAVLIKLMILIIGVLIIFSVVKKEFKRVKK